MVQGKPDSDVQVLPFGVCQIDTSKKHIQLMKNIRVKDIAYVLQNTQNYIYVFKNKNKNLLPHVISHLFIKSSNYKDYGSKLH